MTRLLVHVEGETEETFVNDVLRPHLYDAGYQHVGARLVGNSRAKARRGGIKSWTVVKEDIVKHLAGDPGCLATMMVDYYALPSDWPGRAAAPALAFEQRGPHVNAQILADFAATTPYSMRFEPFVMMHEFEALLFSDCEKFATGIGYPSKHADFAAIRANFTTPEEINDSPATAPSKRVKALIPDYQKPLFGAAAALEIGLSTMRAECPHFNEWLTRLENRVA